MKTTHLLAGFLFLAALVSCGHDEFYSTDEGGAHREIVFTASSFTEDSDINTRTEIKTGGSFIWSANDTVGIYPSSGSQVYFALSEGADAKYAVFDGGGWDFKASAVYRSYYPFIGDIYLDATRIPVSYSGQTQDGNDNTGNIGPFDFMYTPASSPENGTLNFSFSHLNTIIKPRMTLPAGTYTKVTLTLDEPLFVVDGYFDLTSDSPSIQGTSYSNTTSVDLDVTLLSEGLLTAYVMCAPIDMTGKSLKVSFEDTSGHQYHGTYTVSKPYVAEKIYALTIPSYTTGPADNEIWYTTTDGNPLAFESDKMDSWGMTENKLSGDSFALVFNHPVTEIPDNMFYQKGTLQSITLPDATTRIGMNAFFNCYYLENIDFGHNLQSIGHMAFRYCSALTELDLPEGLKSIELYAFQYCRSLKTVKVPASVNDIGTNPFAFCDELEYFLGENSMIHDEAPFYYGEEKTGCVLMDQDGKVISYASNALSNEYIYQLPDNAKSIGQSAFTDIHCRGIHLNNVESLYDQAIDNCPDLLYVVANKPMTSIGSRNFRDCASLWYIQLQGDTVPVIGSGCFTGCPETFRIYVNDVVFNDFLDDAGWSAYSDFLTCTQTSRTIWYHLEGDEDTVLDTSGFDFGANFTGCLSITPATDFKNVHPRVSIPEGLSAGKIMVLTFDDSITTIPDGCFTSLKDKLDYVSAPVTIGENAF
ncbi:MAG: leucine-rich repeat protein [Bacteroidales bacterium]|nr:leucine-rich repeat protein [Bacteroidales bacterium]